MTLNAVFVRLREISALVKLELRKHRLLFWGLAAAYALVPLAAVAAGRLSKQWADSAPAAVLLLAAAGVPFAALVLGPAMGAAARRDWRTDESLPVAPTSRLFAGLFAAAIFLALLCVMIAACASGYAAKIGSPEFAAFAYYCGLGQSPFLRMIPLGAAPALAAFALLPSAFLMSWLTGGAVVGAALALLANSGAALAVLFAFRINVVNDGLYYSRAGVWAALIAATVSLAGVWYFARTSGRSAGLSPARAAGAALVLALPLLGGLLALAGGMRGLKNALMPRFYESYPFLGKTEIGEADGVVAQGLAGDARKDVYFLRPDGSRILLVKHEGPLLGGVGGWGYMGQCLFSADGTLWLTLDRKDGAELYSGRPDGELKLAAMLPSFPNSYNLVRTDTGMELLRHKRRVPAGKKTGTGPEENEYFYAALPFDGKPQWKRFAGGVNEYMARQGYAKWDTRYDVKTCSVSDSRNEKRRTWRLNDGKSCKFFASVGRINTDNGWLFGASVLTKDGKTASALLRKDGSATVIWRTYYPHQLPGGGIGLLGLTEPDGKGNAIHAAGNSVYYTFAPDETANPPLTTLHPVDVLRARAGLVWHVTEETGETPARFVKYDLSAKKEIFSIKFRKHDGWHAGKETVWPPSPRLKEFEACPSGVFEFSNGGVRFYDWDGHSVNIKAAG
ncbi:MAG: hypothetical protein WC421_10985 [Elusimicrobiales bacterium]